MKIYIEAYCYTTDIKLKQLETKFKFLCFIKYYQKENFCLGTGLFVKYVTQKINFFDPLSPYVTPSH